MNDDIKEDATYRNVVRTLFSGLPSRFQDRSAAMQKIRAIVHEEMASAIEHSLNTWVSAQPQATTENRLHLAHEVNRSLSSLGLALQEPDTKEPSDIRVEHISGAAKAAGRAGRFMIVGRGDRPNSLAVLTEEPPLLIPVFDTSHPRLSAVERGPSGSRGR